MLAKITEEELKIFQTLRHPKALSEILFSDFADLTRWDKNKFGNIRMYQIPMLSYDSLFLADPKLDEKENFVIKNGMAESYNLGGRLTGKSLVSIIIDGLDAIFNKTFKWCVISSLDAIHIRGIFEKMIDVLDNHKVLKHLNMGILRSPAYKITGNGLLLESVNDNIVGKNPGGQFFGKHVDKLYKEEVSFLTAEVSNKQLMAQSENGSIFRWSGMTSFTKHSPIGKIFFDIKNRSKIINLPSYYNPTWDDKKEEDAIAEFGGKDSAMFKIQIEGKVIEDMDSVYDIERIRKSYNYKKDVKVFEVDKDTFYKFKEILVVEKQINADKVFLCADIGEGSAPTEIVIIFKVENKYRYVYNVTLHKLSADEQYEIFKFIAETIRANIIGLDTSSGGGKSIASKLAKDFPDNVIWVSFQEKIAVDYEKDAKGNYIVDGKGTYSYKEEYVTDWSITRLKHLFYEEKMECYLDYKLDQQFSNVVAKKSGMRMIYDSKVANHLFQAMQIFSICEWNVEFVNVKPIIKKKMGLGTFGSI